MTSQFPFFKYFEISIQLQWPAGDRNYAGGLSVLHDTQMHSCSDMFSSRSVSGNGANLKRVGAGWSGRQGSA